VLQSFADKRGRWLPSAAQQNPNADGRAREVDHRYGRMLNPTLADYHVPVHADAHQIVEEDDKIVNPLGVKGMGELGLVGIPAAIANGVYHATGIRVRDLPITPDKLINGGLA
jgi:xanthine dehydrogenase YagR molybdenum-binding subunit